MEPEQNIIMPYHRDREMLYYITQLLDKIIPNEVGTAIVGNNNDLNELKVNLSKRFTYIKYNKSILYSRTTNLGVEAPYGNMIILCDQDIFSYHGWCTPLLKSYYPMIILDQ